MERHFPINEILERVRTKHPQNCTSEVYQRCLAALDLTSLSPCDTEQSIRAFVRRALEMPPVASICLYPPFVECAGLEVDGTQMRITAVVGGFPSSQTFLEVKALEMAMAIESGADEVDIVIPVGKVLEGRMEEVQSELELLREEAGEDVTLKVILESGELRSEQLIYDAAMVSMRAGADFIKTSTGKTKISATPEAAIVMALAIKDFHTTHKRRVGLKISGGVRTAEQAALYYTIVEQILGEEHTTPELFRIGASALVDDLINKI